MYGEPTKYLNTDGKLIAFNCEGRLCVLDSARALPTIKLVSSEMVADGRESAWVVIDRIKYLVSSYKGQLSLFRPQ